MSHREVREEREQQEFMTDPTGFYSSTTQESDAVKSIWVSAKQGCVATRWNIFTYIWNNVLELKISTGTGKNFGQYVGIWQLFVF